MFPCGDSMVCIIDDREDIWNNAPNLIRVKPYQFFKGVGDINAPPTPGDIDQLPPEPPPGELVELIDKEVGEGTVDSGEKSEKVIGTRELDKAGIEKLLASDHPEAEDENNSQAVDESNVKLVKQKDANEEITEPGQLADDQDGCGNVSVVVNGDDSDMKQEKETDSQGDENKMSEFSPCTKCVNDEKIGLSTNTGTKDELTVVNNSSAQESGGQKDERAKTYTVETSPCADKQSRNIVQEERNKKGGENLQNVL